jgi:hypothetical protein
MSTTVTKRKLIMNSDMSLSEKLKEHYHTDVFNIEPRSASKVGCLVVLLMNLSLPLEALFILMPTLYGEGEDGVAKTGWLGEGYWSVFFLGLFIWVEFTWNWWRVYFDVPNWVTKETKATHFGQTVDTPPGKTI